MRSRHRTRRFLVRHALAGVLLAPLGCAPRDAVETKRATPARPGPDLTAPELRDEIPPAEVEAVMRAHLQGRGHMERYEYAKAAAAFREVHERAPGWNAGTINLAVALLNQTGDQAAATPGAGGSRGFQNALGLLESVLKRDPNNLHAHFCRGVILEDLGRIADAHRDFVFVTERDPRDAHAWFRVGSTLADADNPERPAGPKQAKALIAIYSRAIELNPYLISALYKLQAAYAWAGERDKQTEALALWRRLNPKSNAAGPGETADNFYGEMGRYAQIIDPLNVVRPPAEPPLPPRFGAAEPVAVSLSGGDRWVRDDDFQGRLAVLGRARAEFGAAVAAFDADGDGRTDLFLAAAVRSARGVRDALLINLGDGTFEDATARFGLPDDRASLGVAAGDFDADRKIDLFLTGLDGNRLLRGAGDRFEDVTERAGLSASTTLSLTARWLDLDQDGDLDLYVVNYTTRAHADDAFRKPAPPGTPNAAYRNDGKPPAVAGRPQDNWAPLALATSDLPATAGLSVAFTPWPDAGALLGGTDPHTAVAALDLDDDRDVDLVLASHNGTRAVINDRLGRFHAATLDGLTAGEPISGLVVVDLDKDERDDLVTIARSGAMTGWRNTPSRGAASPAVSWSERRAGNAPWRSAFAADLDLDTWPDLVGVPSTPDAATPGWARAEGERLTSTSLAIASSAGAADSLRGAALADVVGDALPDLILVGATTAPRVARNLGNGRHWLALNLSGRWKVPPDHMRSNPHGLGTRIALEGTGLKAVATQTPAGSGLGQSCVPLVLGLGERSSAALVRLRWPDGTMQCELSVPADQVLELPEHNRKTGSCPVLFTWNGARFECIGDFLGGGGLGYLVAPGVYGQPDRDEAVAIGSTQLRAERGALRLVIAEPMDEVAYLDRLTLDVIDGPPGVSSAPDERFAPTGRRPTGEIIAWRTEIEPVRAVDLKGKDVTDRLRTSDRRTADGFSLRRGWVGYAEEHGIVLDFGDRLTKFGAVAEVVLCLEGWVEYPYSQTNYAAATAGVGLAPPTLERLRDDGGWEVIEPDAGYPAGLPRLTTLDLTGKLTGPRCVLRLRTNMECYWDRAFIAVRDRRLALRITTLDPAGAELRGRGYLREVSPDGAPPLLYDYDHPDPAPLARMKGRLTRYGPVAPLLQADDDQLCVLGPGDEVRIEFNAQRLPDLPDGWTRRYVLRSIGYCKDADPFTAASDTVEPLPWKGMPDFPFGPEGERRRDAAYRAYLDEYQTRPAGAP